MRQKVCLILITTTLEHQIRITQEAVPRIFFFFIKKKKSTTSKYKTQR